jgi:hypothetical protein
VVEKMTYFISFYTLNNKTEKEYYYYARLYKNVSIDNKNLLYNLK